MFKLLQRRFYSLSPLVSRLLILFVIGVLCVSFPLYTLLSPSTLPALPSLTSTNSFFTQSQNINNVVNTPASTVQLSNIYPKASPSSSSSERLNVQGLNWKDIANEVGWAIPVGGKNRRLPQLRSLLLDLLSGGAGRENIHIFEDTGSRADEKPDIELNALARQWNVHIHHSNVYRRGEETHGLFGLYLAKHYQFMFDTLLLPNNQTSMQPWQQGKTGLGYKYIVFVEDDLQLSPDGVYYFHAMSRVFSMDPTIYCVSAHADNAFRATSIHQEKWRKRRIKEIGQNKPLEWNAALQAEHDRDELDGLNNNILPSTSLNSNSLQVSYSNMDFDFRRGNHFMAPGFMMPVSVYARLRPIWFSSSSPMRIEYHREFHMPNGNWDAFLDSRVGKLECVYPEIPRIAHQGAGGYTVSHIAQAELYDNLFLSTFTPNMINYGNLQRLELSHYNRHIELYMDSCIPIHHLSSLYQYQYQRLCLVVSALTDRDSFWVTLFGSLFGIVSIGGHAGFGKMRGIHQGVVFTKWLTNDLLIIGMFSPFLKYYLNAQSNNVNSKTDKYSPLYLSAMNSMINSPQFPDSVYAHLNRTLTDPSDSLASLNIGCYKDAYFPRAFAYRVDFLWPVSPMRCVHTCEMLGFSYAGVQWGSECYCSHTYDSYGQASEQQCAAQCANNQKDQILEYEKRAWQHSVDIHHEPFEVTPSRDSYMPTYPVPFISQSSFGNGCGGDYTNSVYRVFHPPSPNSQAHILGLNDNLGGLIKSPPLTQDSIFSLQPDQLPHNLVFVKGEKGGDSCDTICASFKGANGQTSYECDESYFPLLMGNCLALRNLFGCSKCRAADGPFEGFSAPGRETDQSKKRGRTGDIKDTREKPMDEIEETSCVMSKGKYLKCSHKPASNTFVRACVCALTE